MTYKVCVDVAHDCPFDAIAQLMEATNCIAMRIIEADGPGGGNPFVEFEFDNADNADEFTNLFHNS